MVWHAMWKLALTCLLACGGLCSVSAQTITYIHTDVLGSPVLETNAQGTVIRQVDYRAFGEELIDGANSTPGQDRPGFTGHYRDVATPFVYMQQRYYDPVIGSFLSADPDPVNLTTAWNFNRYAYAHNNPYKFKDPDGRAIETAWDVFNVGLGLVSLSSNLSDGNYGAAALDGVGVIVDSVAAVVPFVPGGAGTAIKAARAADTVADTVRRVPNPYGKMGGPAHQGKVGEVAAEVESRGLKAVQEYKVDTPGGNKGTRYIDVAGVDPKTGNAVEFNQVGRSRVDGSPISREQRAINDVNGAKPEVPVNYHPYDK